MRIFTRISKLFLKYRGQATLAYLCLFAGAALVLLALASPHGWIGIVSPALMLFFLFRVSGIPLTEAQSLKSKGDDYRRYQRTTSVFVPWFPKKEQHGSA